MNLFSNLFSAPKKKSHEVYDEGLERLKIVFQESGDFYTQIPLFHQQQKQTIPCMMIHPRAGVVLFNLFSHSAKELEGVKASLATKKDKDPDIKSSDAKSLIQLRFDEIFHTQLSPVHSLLVCPNLSEAEFDALDESFHALIPKNLAIFNNSSDESCRQNVFQQSESSYDTDMIKEAIFGEFVLPDTNTLMSLEQQKAVHLSFEKELAIIALPGSGKSSVLVSKALREKMTNPKLRLILLCKHACNVHALQALIFKSIENSHWGLNPAEILVDSFESLQKRSRGNEHYDLVVCDDIGEKDLSTARKLLGKKGRLLLSSSYAIETPLEYPLTQNYRLSPALCAACEGLEVEKLRESLSLQSGNPFMNTILILKTLLQEVKASEISIVHHSKEELLNLQNEINTFFTPISSLFDAPHKQENLLLYPLSRLSCVLNRYVIVIVDSPHAGDTIELISRATGKSFILSHREEIHQLIKGKTRETL